MTDDRHLEGLLRAQDGDAGCAAGEDILDAYVELELVGADPAKLPRLPGRSRRSARSGPPLLRPRARIAGSRQFMHRAVRRGGRYCTISGMGPIAPNQHK